jgi:Transglutaminase-like superfamily
MGRLSLALLHLRLIKELIRYDVMEATLGFRGIHALEGARPCIPLAPHRRSSGRELESLICEAMKRMVPLYWKRVQCLQRSVVTARLLRAYGAQADVVIGYRLAPFLAHAWVEVGSRMVNDSPTFQARLHVLERF